MEVDCHVTRRVVHFLYCATRLHSPEPDTSEMGIRRFNILGEWGLRSEEIIKNRVYRIYAQSDIYRKIYILEILQ